jgi:ATP-dependent helicase/nuclease subunit B
LPGRARQLFGEAEVAREDVPPSVSFPLNILSARDPGAADLPDSLHVTAFAAYLGCPFRYYLSRVLGMNELDDRKMELDALDFGILVHHALEKLGRSEELRVSSDVEMVGNYLADSAESFAYGRYGSHPPLSVEIQLRSATERLRKAAEVHVAELAEGWEILDVERRVQGEIEGMTIVGKIDRIDRHRETGACRLLDYKTSESADPAAKAHVGGSDPESRPYSSVTVNNKQGTWSSLQLPLYRMLLEQEGFGAGVGIGFFNLPKAVVETGVSMWENFDEKLLDRADHCARGVIRDIRSGRFWPPRESVKYDDFERLFPAAYAACVDPASQAKLMPGKEGGAA